MAKKFSGKTQIDGFGSKSPSTHGVGGGEYDQNKPPFGEPHSTGGDTTLPIKMYDGMDDSVGASMPAPGMGQRTGKLKPSKSIVGE